MAGLGGKKQICVRYKKGKSGKLRCAEKRPASQCVKKKGKLVCGASPVSRRSKLYKTRMRAGHVAGACRTTKGRFKKGCKRS
jgi:hypothetical protein